MNSRMITDLDYVGAALEAALDILDLYEHPGDAKGGVLVRTKGMDDLCRVRREAARVTVSFAGTRNWEQWLSNAQHLGVQKRMGGFGVHPGAAVSFAAFERGLMDALAECGALLDHGSAIPVDVRGHSRGWFLEAEFVRVIGSRVQVRDVINLGGPRAGNAEYGRRVLMHVGGKVVRWSHNNDPVVLIPGAWRGYRHFGEHRHIDSRGRMHRGGLGAVSGFLDGAWGRTKAVLNLRAFDGADDHRLPSGYVPALLKLFAELGKAEAGRAASPRI